MGEDTDALQVGSVTLVFDSNTEANEAGSLKEQENDPTKFYKVWARSLPQPRVQEKLVMGSDQRSILLDNVFFSCC